MSAVSGKRLRRSDGAVSTTVLSQTAIRPGVSELLASEKLDRVEEKVRRAAAQAQRDQAKRKDPPRESRASEPQQGSNGRRPRAGADANGWSPQQKDVLQVKMSPEGCTWHTQDYSVLAIAYDATLKMLDWLLPQLSVRTGAVVAKRDTKRSAKGDGEVTQRGSSIILTRTCSNSSAHADLMDTLIYCHAGHRKVATHTRCCPHKARIAISTLTHPHLCYLRFGSHRLALHVMRSCRGRMIGTASSRSFWTTYATRP